MENLAWNPRVLIPVAIIGFLLMLIETPSTYADFTIINWIGCVIFFSVLAVYMFKLLRDFLRLIQK